MPRAPLKRASIEQIAAQHEDSLLNIHGVEAVGISELHGRPVIRIFISGRPEQMKKRLPRKLDGYSVILTFSGELVAS